MSVQPLGVGIVGCGLIGQKRAKALGDGGRLAACTDSDCGKAEKLAKDYGGKAVKDWNELFKRREVELVIVATLHDSLADGIILFFPQ